MWFLLLSDELTTKSAAELIALIGSRACSPVEVIEAHLRRIDAVNPKLNAVVTLAPDALDRARRAEDSLMSKSETGPLHGLPITVKDTIDTKGLRTTSGSRLRATHVPAQDASVIALLKAAGAIVLGKTNTPEMAIPYETDNPVFGRTNNPHDVERTAGGSSGGEAAAIAAFLSPAGIGSDLSGSIRVPAHFCGIAGLKPTTGRVSMDGHVPETAGTLALGACIGPMARYVKDLRLLFRVMAEGLPASTPAKAKRVAFYVDDHTVPVTADTAKAVHRAAEILAAVGFEIREEVPPGIAEGPRLWLELFARAAADQLREFYRGQETEAGPAVVSVLNAHPEVSSFAARIEAAERLAQAVVEREQLREDLLRWLKRTPIIIAPVGAISAFRHAAKNVEVNGQSVLLGGVPG